VEYELDIRDRIVLVQIFATAPKLGSYLYYKELARVGSEVSIPDEEQKAIGWKVEKDEQGNVQGLKWDDKKAGGKTVEMPECIESMVVDALKRLDKQEKLMPEHIPVYEKFVLPWEERHGPEV